MKPFIRPQPANSPASPPPPPASHSVTPGELSILSLAAAIADPAERTAYLARACRGDDALRARIEERIEARAAQTAHSQPASPAVVRPQQIAHHSQEGQAVALVPMTAAQLANATAPRVKPNTIPWLAATLLAAAAGGLAVLFSMERTNRAKADHAAIEAQGATADARQQRIEAEAAALEIKTAAERAAQKAREERDAALAAADREKAAREAAETGRTQADERMKAAEAAATTAREEAQREKTAATDIRNAANAALAETLSALATAQMDARNYPAAVQSARQSLEIRTTLGVTGWQLIENHTLLGTALLQTNKDADAALEIIAAAKAIESLGAPADDAAKARFADTTRRIVRFLTVTGRRKEAAEWKEKFSALANPPAQ